MVREDVEGLQSRVEELTVEKTHIQQNYDDLSAAVDARVDQLQAGVLDLRCTVQYVLLLMSVLLEAEVSV